MSRTYSRPPRLFLILVVSTAALTLVPCFSPAQVKQTDDLAAKAKALDYQIIADAKKGPELMVNLTHLSDIIGPRLTGSPALKKANDWAAEKMKAYGLVNVHNEPWLFPEGWQRGSAAARLLEPDNGCNLSLASWGWMPGTDGKVQADVIAVQATKAADLNAYKGKLKGKIVLDGPPKKLRPLAEIEKAGGQFSSAVQGDPSFEYTDVYFDKLQLFEQEGAVAILHDAAKHHGLLFAMCPWIGERPSAQNKTPTLSVAHEHYTMLYRLATRPAPAQTRMELHVTNKFIPGPVKVYNTVGEIRGADKPDEFVVVGAHLDSWDLGQGTLDNGTGCCVVLEAARQLARCAAPKRTIRFVLFAGEEQGLHGSRAYIQQHEKEMPRTSACLIHDTGTGKVNGLGWLGNREVFQTILETELAALTELGVKYVAGRGTGNSDHVSFHLAGVPACAVHQEIAGYRFAHHSQADTLELAREADLIQGTQVLAVTALRLANLGQLLPQTKK